MKKVIRLTESDLLNIVKRVISEQESQPSDNNFIQQKYTEFTNLLTPTVRDAFIKQYPVQDAMSELNSCKPSKFENFKTKLTGLKDKLKSFVSGSDLNKDIQSVSSYLEKTPNVNEQTGVVILSGLAMLLLVSLYKSFLFGHGYVPSKSCMGPGSHLPIYLEGTFNLLNDLFHFRVNKHIGGPQAGRERDKFNVKKHQKALKNIDKEYNRQQKQQTKQAQQDARMLQRSSEMERKEYYANLIKYFEGFVKENYQVGNVKGYLTSNPEEFESIFKEFIDNSAYTDDSSKTVSNYIKKYYKLV